MFTLLHPNDETEKSVNPARAAGSHFVSGHMLAQALPTARAFSPHYPITK